MREKKNKKIVRAMKLGNLKSACYLFIFLLLLIMFMLLVAMILGEMQIYDFIMSVVVLIIFFILISLMQRICKYKSNKYFIGYVSDITKEIKNKDGMIQVILANNNFFSEVSNSIFLFFSRFDRNQSELDKLIEYLNTRQSILDSEIDNKIISLNSLKIKTFEDFLNIKKEKYNQYQNQLSKLKFKKVLTKLYYIINMESVRNKEYLNTLEYNKYDLEVKGFELKAPYICNKYSMYMIFLTLLIELCIMLTILTGGFLEGAIALNVVGIAACIALYKAKKYYIFKVFKKYSEIFDLKEGRIEDIIYRRYSIVYIEVMLYKIKSIDELYLLFKCLNQADDLSEEQIDNYIMHQENKRDNLLAFLEALKEAPQNYTYFSRSTGRFASSSRSVGKR